MPNCGEDGCQAAHHHLLHGALVQGRVMVVQEIGARKAEVFLCREDVRVRSAGGANSLHTLYDWGATVTLVTHAAAAKAGLERETGGCGHSRAGRPLHHGRQLLHGAGC